MKIRFAAYIILGVASLISTQSYAGTVNATDGQGTWLSTQCQVPQLPQVMTRNPEAAANDLNTQITQHNEFVAAAQVYMNCVSQEAQSDAASSGQMITRSAQALIEQMQMQIANSASFFKGR